MLEEALADLDRSLSLNPNDALAHLSRAFAFSHMERLQESASSLKRALEINAAQAEDPFWKPRIERLRERLAARP
jgi:Tfp pilus assembly protein PilF